MFRPGIETDELFDAYEPIRTRVHQHGAPPVLVSSDPLIFFCMNSNIDIYLFITKT